MALWVKLILAGIGLVAVGLGLAIWHGSARWQGKTSQFVENLIQAGEFRARKADDGWSLFEAKQYFTGKGESLRLSMISHGDMCRDIKSA
jgi:hypothetical protein